MNNFKTCMDNLGMATIFRNHENGARALRKTINVEVGENHINWCNRDFLFFNCGKQNGKTYLKMFTRKTGIHY